MAFFKGAFGSDDSFTEQLLQLSKYYSGEVEKNKASLQNEAVFLGNQLGNATTLDSLNNLSSTVSDYNKRVSSQGYDEYAINYQDKKSSFTQANLAYEEGKSILDKNLGNEDKLYNEIMGYSWGETAEEVNKMYNLRDSIDRGIKSKFHYKANGRYSGRGYSSARYR